MTDCLRETHRRYTRAVNLREGWRGYLWHGRFASCFPDEAHLLAAARYVERNPARAGLCAEAAEWPWSSARSHLEDRADALTNRRPLLDRIVDWAALARMMPRRTSACAPPSAAAGRSPAPA